MELLDLVCAEYGEEIAKAVNDETIITKTIGVLQEDGVYAFFLYCKSKKDKTVAVGDKAFDCLKDHRMLRNIMGNDADHLKTIRDVFKGNLEHLLFAKELLERTLVYARYHAKANPSPQSSPPRGEEVRTSEEDK
jgi:hypothetical protein